MKKKIEAYPNFSYEKKLWNRGYRNVAGMDEVGRGCFAGPIVCGSVVFSSNFLITNSKFQIKIDDSKKLTPRQREIADEWIRESAVCWGVGKASVSEINKYGLSKATASAFRRSLVDAKKRGSDSIDYLLIDAFYIPYVRGYPKGKFEGKKGSKKPKIFINGSKQLAVVNGDEKSISIAAASIIAKVYRDNLMIDLSKKSKYKKYKWRKNKGYGTKEHQKAIKKYGTTRHHRKKFVETFLNSAK
ncbi:hypothetical protein A2Z22_03750 [Candidatus Woesebacteria bacterium RBG_16_34_12]|uniref:Ribonuclease n=1 Tax=Candidatus Woesebacteria bacterium RBG_16_34_12 TaxID=1802480 RepID=A0A1F7X7A8_9BACT|nr:MAG: hypothetical protein A2Z22_03750 [Candidatus Woesebacteria bacterium RBG_16_34_12]